MNGKNADVIVAALGALPAQRTYQLSFALPVTTILLQAISVAIPICLLAIGAAKAGSGRIATLDARSIVTPSLRVVAGHAAILARPALQSVGVDLKHLSAMLARLCHPRFLSHGLSIAHIWGMCKSGYFEIAKKRISDAQLQIRMRLT